MAVIIREIRNNSASAALIVNNARPSDTDGSRGRLQPGESRILWDVTMEVPTYSSIDTLIASFDKRHIAITLASGQTFAIWQASHGGADRIRVSTDRVWHEPGDVIGGLASTGLLEDDYLKMRERTLIINDFTLWMLPVWASGTLRNIAKLRQRDRYKIVEQPARDIQSVPKKSTVVFSMAGGPSQAKEEGTSGARFLYRDSGRRYEFQIKPVGVSQGVVHVTPPVLKGGTQVGTLRDAISYERSRTGERFAAPVFDLIASNGGRVFAKEKDRDRFFFAVVDHGYIHAGATGPEFDVPNTYCKLDPLLASAEGAEQLAVPLTTDFFATHAFADHPAAERFPLFKLLLSYGVLDMMVVRVERLTWHLLDVRTPLMNLFAHIPEALSSDMPNVTEARTKVRGYIAGALLTEPPDGVPVRQHVLYRGDPLPVVQEEEALAPTLAPLSLDGDDALPRDWSPGDDPPQDTPYQAPDVSRMGIDYKLVLDIGVGHVHHHEQYQGITGGEIQPLRTPTTAADVFDDPLEPYRFMNGPIRDGDGYIDGTCNFYLLVQLATPAAIDEAAERNTLLRRRAYGLLYIDEQTFFAQRWHLAHPDDWRGAEGSVVARVHGDGARFKFNPGHFWCPFRAGHVGPRSRLAVAAQVALVNGEDPDTREPLLYSINFSFVSMDRTWRWRKLPAPARYFDGTSLWLPQPVSTVTGEEQVSSGPDACVYPQTLRLRDDMTICFQGRGPGPEGPGQIGRWYQRYLTGANELVPSAGALTHQVSAVCGGLMLRKRQLEQEWATLNARQYELVHAAVKDIEAIYAVAEELKANRLAQQEVDDQWAQNGCGDTLRPKEGYTHPWRFLPESVFRRADQFSHFGVYDVVDARTQYYLVTPASDADAKTLAAAEGREPGAWVDASGQIRVEGYTFRFDWLRLPLTNAWTFNLLWSGLARDLLSFAEPFRHFFGTQQFAAPVSAPTELRPPRDRKLRPSMFNPETRLRIVRRGSQWIAMHRDKRDDDLIEFIPDSNPVQLQFQGGRELKDAPTASARVTLGKNYWVEEPPAARIGYFRWQPAGSSLRAVIGFVPSRPQGWRRDVWRNVWRVRMAAFSETGAVLRLLDNGTSPDFLSRSHACFEYSWEPSAAEERDLRNYCTAAGAARYGTTIWLEDVVGHVNVPDEVRWSDEPRWSDPIETLVGSFANADRYVRRVGDKVTLTPLATDVDRQEARFVIVPGLSGGRGVSFESMNARGQFLRHQGFLIKLHAFEDDDLYRADATFHRRPGLANPGSASFESVNYPGRFVRQKSSELWVEPVGGDRVLYNADATFRLVSVPTPAPSTSVLSSASVGGKGSVGSTSMTSGIGAKQL